MSKYKNIGFKTGLITGFFGSGGGSYLVPKLENDLKFNCKVSHATSIAIILPTCIFTALLYLYEVNIDFFVVSYICMGGLIGGVIGSKTLIYMNNKYIKILFGMFLIFIGVKLII